MSESKEQLCNFYLAKARAELERVEKVAAEDRKRHDRRREQIVMEFVQHLEENNLTREYIVDFVIRGLNGYGISESTIRRILKRKYEVLEESTVQIESEAENDANRTGQSTVQVIGGEEEGPPTPAKEVKRLREELDTAQQTINEQARELSGLRLSQELKDIPHTIIEDRVGKVEVKDLSRISEYQRNGFKALVARFAEAIRRKMTGEGHATVKFYILTKDRTTNIKYLVPVNYTVDMFNKSTDVTLDEDRL